MKHGGKRKNAGRKLKYGEETKVMRVPKSKIQLVEKILKTKI